MGATIERVDETRRFLEITYLGCSVLIHLQLHNMHESVLIVAARKPNPNDIEVARGVFERVQIVLLHS